MFQKMLLLTFVIASTQAARADLIEISITNTAPVGGTFLTPVFVGAHTGSFSLFTPGQPASAGLERIAEDGGPATMLLNDLAASGGVGGVAGAGPIAPGETVSIMLDVNALSQRFLTFASMVIPSNDAFIGNPSAMLFPLFDAAGNFIPRNGGSAIRISGSQVWDSGTEVNDEIPANTAFLAQAAPNTGVDENGTVQLHAGFQGSQRLGGPNGAILNDPRFPNGDFSVDGYQVAEITVNQVPAPPAVVGLGFGALVLGWYRRRKTNAGELVK